MTLSTLLPMPTSDMGIRWISTAVVHGVDLRLAIELAGGSSPGSARLTVWSPPKHNTWPGSPCLSIPEQRVEVSATTPVAMAFARAMAALEPLFSLELAQQAVRAQHAEWSRNEW